MERGLTLKKAQAQHSSCSLFFESKQEAPTRKQPSLLRGTHIHRFFSLQLSSDDESSDGEGPQVSPADLEALISGHYPSTPEEDGGPGTAPETLDKWVCAQPSSQKATNYNLHLTEKLEVLAKAYSVQGDKWRALGYAKAISALKNFHKPVSSYQVLGGWGRGLLFTSCGKWQHLPPTGIRFSG